MNWYKRAQGEDENDNKKKIGDLFSYNLRYSYPLNGVKKVPGIPEWFIDLKSNQGIGNIPDINDLELGDEIWDENLHAILNKGAKPYWRIEGIDIGSGKIAVIPINDNPMTTGIGAGGHKLTDFDYHVHSGEHEKEAIDRVLKRIKARDYVHPIEVAYILLGTVPMRMGANGAEGGWYNAGDIRSNRGGMRGMSESEIIKKDAASLKKMGFTLPEGALEGKIKEIEWNDFMSGGTSLRMFRYENHPKNEHELAERIFHEKNPVIARQYFKELTKLDGSKSITTEVIKKLSSYEEYSQFDERFLLKEDAIAWAAREKEYELIIPFLYNSNDVDVRWRATRELLKAGIINAEERLGYEMHPKIVEDIISHIKKTQGKKKALSLLLAKEEDIENMLGARDYEIKLRAKDLLEKINKIKSMEPKYLEIFDLF